MFKIIKWPLINILIFGALVFGGVYIYQVFAPFLLSLFYYLKLNIPSIAYIFLRSVNLLCPLLLFTIAATKSNTAKCLRMVFNITGICYLLGNTWVIYFLVLGNPVSALLDVTQLTFVQRSEALVLNYLMWNCFSLWNILFSTVQGILYLLMARQIMYSRRKTLRIGGIICIISVVVPIICGVTNPSLQNYVSWIRNNVFFLLSQISIYTAMLVAGTNRKDWIAFAYKR